MPPLQWGRVVIDAERRVDASFNADTEMLQWGRVVIDAERCRIGDEADPGR